MNMLTKIRHLISGPEISLFHEFHQPPYGGGNQFLLALEKEFKQRGLDVGRNKVGPRTKICLFNSFNFDFEKLMKLKQKFPQVKMVHRVDGPISAYRGTDEAVDKKIWEINHQLADQTIFQSQYSLDEHTKMGLVFKNPIVITNASDPVIFNRDNRATFPQPDLKVHLIAVSWSDNPKKGGAILSWFDEHLDQSRFTLTFVGRTQASLKHAQVLPPLNSEALAKVLKRHDIYLADSENDPCSNALIEALSCGLPA